MRTAARAFGLVVVFLTAIVAALVIHIDVPATRRVLRGAVNQQLAATFKGEVALGEIERIGADHVRVASFSVSTPEGQRVLQVDELAIEGPWLSRILGAVLAGGGIIDPGAIRVARTELTIERDEAGTLGLVRAFEPRKKPTPPTTIEAPKPSAYAVRLGDVELASVRVIADLPSDEDPARRIDAHLSGLDVELYLRGPEVRVALEHVAIWEEHLLGKPIALEVNGDVQLFGPERSIAAHVEGSVGRIPIRLDGGTDGEHHAVRVALTSVSPEELRAWLPDLPLKAPLTVELAAQGTMNQIRLAGSAGRADAADPVVRVDGTARVSDAGVLIDLEVALAKIDAALFGAKPTDVSGELRVRAALSEQQRVAAVDVRLAPSTVQGQRLPQAYGVVHLSETGGAARVRVEEPGVGADAWVRFAKDEGARFRLEVGRFDIEGVPRLAALIDQQQLDVAGHADLELEGKALLDDTIQIDAALVAGFDRVRVDQVSVGRATLRAHAHGPIDALNLDAQADGFALAVGKTLINDARVTVRGPLKTPAVSASLNDKEGRSVNFDALVRRMAPGPDMELAGARLQVERGRTKLDGRVARIRAHGERVALDGIEIKGIGQPIRGNLALVGKELTGNLAAPQIDLLPLSRLLMTAYPLLGTASVEFELAGLGAARRGRLDVGLQDGEMLVVSGVQLDLKSTFEGDLFRPHLVARLEADGGPSDPCRGDIARITLSEATVTHRGAVLDPTSWQRAGGGATIDASPLVLPCLAKLWALVDSSTKLPERLDGTAHAKLRLEREPLSSGSSPVYPSIRDLSIRSEGLAVVLNRPGDLPADAPAWKRLSTDRLDVIVSGGFDAASHTLSAALDLMARPTTDVARLPPVKLVRLELEHQLDADALAKGQDALRATLPDAPLSVTVQAERRPVQAWQAIPMPWRDKLMGYEGQVGLLFSLTGTLRDPTFALRIRGDDVVLPNAEAHFSERPSFDLIANYGAGFGHVNLTASAGSALARLDASGEGPLDLSALVEPRDPKEADEGPPLSAFVDPAKWKAKLEAHLKALPLGAIPQLSERGLTGTVGAEVLLTGLGAEPRVAVRVGLEDLAVDGDRSVDALELSLRSSAVKDVLLLESRIQPARGGDMTITGYGSTIWKEGWVPEPNLAKPAALLLRAQRFGLGALEPFVTPAVSRLSGTLDGDARFAWREVSGKDIDVDVDMRVQRGVMVASQIGKLSGIEARIKGTERLVRVDDLVAFSGAGRLDGWLALRMDGRQFEDLTGVVKVDRASPMPVTIEGQPLGMASGTVLLSVVGSGDMANVSLTGADIHLELTPGAGQQLQPLEEHGDIEVSQALGPPTDDGGAAGKLVNLTLRLSKVTIAGTGLSIAFGTDPEAPIHVAAGHPSGSIVIEDGHFDLLGKRFEIDSGVVRLRDEDPSNPYVNVTAHWTSPDGATVYVDYIGNLKPINRDKFVFRSEPARSPEQVLALLLLGGDAGLEDTAGGGRAANLGGALFAAQLNGLLGGVVPGLSTSAGTSSEGYAEAKLSYQLSDSVTASATYESAQGSAVDAAARSTSNDFSARTTFSLDWRFYKGFLLRGNLGVGDDANRGVDILWNHRY